MTSPLSTDPDSLDDAVIQHFAAHLPARPWLPPADLGTPSKDTLERLRRQEIIETKSAGFMQPGLYRLTDVGCDAVQPSIIVTKVAQRSPNSTRPRPSVRVDPKRFG